MTPVLHFGELESDNSLIDTPYLCVVGRAMPTPDDLAAAPAEHPPLVAYVCGTELDPQDYEAQVRALRQAGALIAPSNADAAQLAATIVSS